MKAEIGDYESEEKSKIQYVADDGVHAAECVEGQ